MAASMLLRRLASLAALFLICRALEEDALEQCVDTDSFGVSDENKIPNAQITASSSMTKREGYKGRLFAGGAWQAASNNYNQYIQVDLGDRRLITSVATQGYRGSGQFVIDYYITHSNDNSTFVAIVNDLGDPKVFPGNTHDDKPQFNLFQNPIVAQFVRFVPRRWNINIAMRVELYGCAYDGKSASFNGNSSISFNAYKPNSLYTTIDMLRFRMKTSSTEGVIFYASGNQGDHICLEMWSGRLYIDINLGFLSWTSSGTRAVVGSLLDDNQWHDVQLIREYKNVTVSVDRVPVNVTVPGEFERLDLDRYLYLGAVPTFYQPGISVRKNFVGCIENFVWNGIHMTRDKDLAPRFSVQGNLASGCSKSTPTIPITLPSKSSHITYSAASVTENNLQFRVQFRTYDKDRLLIWNTAKDEFNFFLTIGIQGYVEIEMTPNAQSVNSYIVREIARNDENDGSYADGLWHDLEFRATTDSIVMVIDGKEFKTTRQLTFSPGSTFYIGGGHPEKQGFVGCLRNVILQYEVGTDQELSCPNGNAASSTKCNGVQLNTCDMEDRCRPNPCEHGGICQQTFSSFTCECSETGYKGATCHQSIYPVSCSRVFELRTRDSGLVSTTIDIDGAGSLEPFNVICKFNQETDMVETELYHDSTREIMVDGYQQPGSYRRVIKYDTNLTQIDQLVYRATTCRQYIQYRCESSRLLENPSSGTAPGTDGSEDGTGPEIEQVYKAYGWWIGRNNQFNYYWGGAAPGTGKCKCGIEGNCQGGKTTCNCDAGLPQEQIADGGDLTYKEHLPVMELRFGDTLALNDRKRGWHKLGPLICAGDRLFDQPVTFRKTDSVIFFDTFWSRNAWELKTWDISFRFKTTAENGVMVNRIGESDFIEIKLVTSTSISFRFSAGYGIQAVVVETAFQLNDDKWHTVYAERNRLEALLQVDEFAPERLPHPRGVGYLPFQFTSPLVVGASTEYNDGYVGCLSSLQVNGETLDLYNAVANDKRFKYGLDLGCTGRCEPNPCLNGGLCKEKYSNFICDCSYTPYRGLICGREVGISLYQGQLLAYRPPTPLSSNSENITVGFFTREKKGVILQLTSALRDPKEYMVIEMNNNGGIRVSFKFNVERLQVNTQIGKGVDFANGQQHVLKFQRVDGGRKMRLQVDNYEPITEEDLSRIFPPGSDLYLNFNYILVGRNTSLNSEFVGCIYRTEVDNHWPIKRVFQEPRPQYVRVYESDDMPFDWVGDDCNAKCEQSFKAVREDRCGFEEILPEDEPLEIRPTYEPPIPISKLQEELEEQTTGQNALMLGLIFGFVAIILVIIVSVIVYMCCKNEPEKDDDLEMVGLEDREYDDDDDDDDEVYNPKRSSEAKYNERGSVSGQRFL